MISKYLRSFSIRFQMAKTPFVPFLLFGSTAILAAATILLCPDTFSKKLPDSVEEAKDL